MTSTGKKILLGAAGTVGAGLLSWRALFPWIGYDLQAMGRYKRLLSALENGIKSGRLLIDIFETTAEKYPKKAFVIFEDRVYSYEFMNEQANRVANIAAKWGLKVGECVAIMMENQPAFIWTFLGLQKLGIATALLNFNIKGQPLVHMLRTCEARFLICSSAENLVHTVEDVRNDILDIPVYVQGHSSHRHFESWDSLMHTTLPVPICPTIRQDVGHDTTSCYIFTSGTTGLPKPAIVTQLKCIGFTSFLQLFGFTSGDIVYTTIPLYHSAAFGVGLLNVIGQGATMVLKRKFSAHQFFEDVRKYDVTVIQYIGELCRYLLAVPESPLDGKNKVRLAVGNGLRADVWNKFKERFRIPEIGEFFAATEGTSAFVNLCNRTGSVGRYSPLMVRYYHSL